MHNISHMTVQPHGLHSNLRSLYFRPRVPWPACISLYHIFHEKLRIALELLLYLIKHPLVSR